MAARATVTSDERRSYGIDRRTVGPALLVVALALLTSIILPQIDSETHYRDAVHEGDVVALADGITLVPTPGWDLATGAVVGQTRSPVADTTQTELVHGSVDFYVQAEGRRKPRPRPPIPARLRPKSPVRARRPP